jgi:nucleoside-diphosphate-sugar epimerase
MPKLITVVGATGIQGGSVIKALLHHPEYSLRAITRNVQSAPAQALAKQGVKVVNADLNNVESLKAAFEGSYGIYAVTNFFEAFPVVDKEKAIEIEAQLGANLADAAAATSSLQHFIWSSLPNSQANSGGKVVVPHYEGKNRVDEHIRSLPELHKKTTFMWILWYAQNIQYPFYQPFQIPGTSGDTLYQLQATPGSQRWMLSGDAATNVGLFVHAILEQPEKTLPSKYVLATSDEMTADEVVQAWASVQGKNGRVLTVSKEAYYGAWPMWAEVMDLSHTYLGTPGAYEQAGEHVLTRDDLKVEGLVGTKEFFKKLQQARQ